MSKSKSKSKRASDKPAKPRNMPSFIWAQWSHGCGISENHERPWLLADETPELAAEARQPNELGIGVYKLVRVVKISTVTTAVETTLESYE